jgi:6-phosphofructokinase 1
VNTADIQAITSADLTIARLGERTVDSPLGDLLGTIRDSIHYVTEHDRVLIDDTLGMATRRGGLSAELRRSTPADRGRSSTSDPRRSRPRSSPAVACARG